MENQVTTLAAFNPSELKATQADLKHWLKEKRDTVLREANDLQTAASEAKKHKWKVTTLAAAAARALKRSNYYDRALKAVEAGYILIPPFPLRIFAVRVNIDKPRSRSSNYMRSVPDAKPTNVPVGKGRYISNLPMVSQDEHTDDKGTPHKTYWATGYQDVEFPLEAAKPYIMQRASEAMALKIFDEIGMVGQRADPILVGSVMLKQGYHEKRMNFFIAWWLDQESL